MNKLLTIGELLRDEQLPFDHGIVLPEEPKWRLDTVCAIVESDEMAEDEDHPLAIENNLTCSIGSNEVMDIIANAHEQLAHATVEQLLEALEYYCDNDAFIDFNEPPNGID
jgi:hypothetical protein